MKNYLKILSLTAVVLCFGFSGEKKKTTEKKIFFYSAQAGRFYVSSGGCYGLDRCSGSDMTFDDPNGYLGTASPGTYGWFVLSGSSSTCVNRLLSWDEITECP